MESHTSQVAPNARGFDQGLRLGACLDIPHSDENTNSASREGTRPTSAHPCCRPRALTRRSRGRNFWAGAGMRGIARAEPGESQEQARC